MSTLAELSSVATGLEEMARRITVIVEGLTGDEAEALTADLFEVERALGTASRRLSRLLDARN